ncbi:MAG: hypothetical protein VKN33_09730 [Candidatus Sericytochromatia bacterium]|nr:hypothetical protein [Candidatus Sericytochromatia bacterium]
MTQPYFPVPMTPIAPPVAPPPVPVSATPVAPPTTWGRDGSQVSAPPVVTVAVNAPPPPLSPSFLGSTPGAYPSPFSAQPAFSPAVAPAANFQMGAANLGQGPIAQAGAAGIAALSARIIPAGTAAAVGAASAIARNTNATMVKNVSKAVEAAGEPLLKLSWALVGNTFEALGALLTFRIGDAFKSIGKVFSDGALSLGAAGKKLAQPITLTAATSGGKKLGFGQALGSGLAGGMKALKSSVIWAIPASAINAFVDYKYRDQNDVKRLGTNFAADMLGYTATGMAGAAVGAAIGSMTVPLVGTLVGAVVGVGLGFLHDRITRPVISDALYDAV